MGTHLKHIFLGCLLSLIVQISYCIHVVNNDYLSPHYCKACSSISSSVDSQSITPKHEDLIEIPPIPIVSDRFHNAIKPVSIQHQPQQLQIDTSAFKSCGCKTSPQPQVEYESQVPSAPAKNPQCTCPICLNSTTLSSTSSTRQFIPYSYPEIQQFPSKSQPVCSCASSQLSSGLPPINKLLPSSSASTSGTDCGCSSVSSNIPSQSSTLPPPPQSNYLPQPITIPEYPSPCSCSRSLPQQSRSHQLTPSLLVPPFKYLPQYSPLALSPIILPQQPWHHPYFINGRPLILPTISPCQLNALKSLQSHGYANEIPSVIHTDTDSESLLKAYKELDQSKYYAQDVSEGSEPDLSSVSYNKYNGDH